MKNICIIGPSYPYRGGIAQHTTLMGRYLRSDDCRVLHISFKRQYPKWLYGREDKIEHATKHETQTEYIIDSINPFTWREAARKLKRWEPDLVIIPWWVPFWAPLFGYLSRSLKKSCPKAKLIFMCHNVLPHEKSMLDVWALKLGLSYGDGYVVHAKSEEEKLLEFLPAATVLVTPHPTYAEIGNDKKKPENLEALYAHSNSDLNLLFCGIVRHYKGLDILIESLALLKHEAHLFIVGDFWEKEKDYREQIQQLGLSDRVTIVNEYVPDDVFASYVSQADIVVLPYRSATQSGVVQMALGHGTPVIITQAGGLAEAVIHGETGFVVPTENPVAIANAIDHFYANPDNIDFANNIAKSQKDFSWELFVERVLSFADQL